MNERAHSSWVNVGVHVVGAGDFDFRIGAVARSRATLSLCTDPEFSRSTTSLGEPVCEVVDGGGASLHIARPNHLSREGIQLHEPPKEDKVT